MCIQCCVSNESYHIKLTLHWLKHYFFSTNGNLGDCWVQFILDSAGMTGNVVAVRNSEVQRHAVWSPSAAEYPVWHTVGWQGLGFVLFSCWAVLYLETDWEMGSSVFIHSAALSLSHKFPSSGSSHTAGWGVDPVLLWEHKSVAKSELVWTGFIQCSEFTHHYHVCKLCMCVCLCRCMCVYFNMSMDK